MENNNVTFEKKWLDRNIPLRFKINYWFLKKLGLEGFRILLILGGYISGTSLNGAPLLVAVYMQNIDVKRLRNTLFVLWFLLVMIKMSAFLIVDVYINWQFSLMLIPVAALGHFDGLKVHHQMIENDTQFKRWMGSALILICAAGLSKVLIYT